MSWSKRISFDVLGYFLDSSSKVERDKTFQSKKFNALHTFDPKQTWRAQIAFMEIVGPRECVRRCTTLLLDSSWKIGWDGMFQSSKLTAMCYSDPRQTRGIRPRSCRYLVQKDALGVFGGHFRIPHDRLRGIRCFNLKNSLLYIQLTPNELKGLEPRSWSYLIQEDAFGAVQRNFLIAEENWVGDDVSIVGIGYISSFWLWTD